MTEMGRGAWPDEPPFPDEWSPSDGDLDFVAAQEYGYDVRDPEELTEMRYLPPPELDEREPHPDDLAEYLFHIDYAHLVGDWDDEAWFEDEITTSDPEPLPAGIEYANATDTFELFKDVQVIEDEDGVRFHVPRRIIKTADGEVWGLDVYGKRRHFKERDDYGEIRFMQNERNNITGARWLPHLYPWEDVTETGMPLIPDRERCDVTVALTNLRNTGLGGDQVEVAITTPDGRYQAQEDISLSYNPRGDRYFLEFVDIQRRQHADVVNFSNAIGDPPSALAFIQELYMNGEHERAGRLLRGEEDLPPQFDAYYRPDDWQDREKYTTAQFAIGGLWVPIDRLRSGTLQAEITFPSLLPAEELGVRGIRTLHELAGRTLSPSQEMLGVMQDTVDGLLAGAEPNEHGQREIEFMAETGDRDAPDYIPARARELVEPGIENRTADGKRRNAVFTLADGRIYELWTYDVPAEWPLEGSPLPFEEQTESMHEFRAHGEAEPNWESASPIFRGLLTLRHNKEK